MPNAWQDIINRSPALQDECIEGPVQICCDANNAPILCVGESSLAAGKKKCGCNDPVAAAIVAGWQKKAVFELIDKLKG